MKFRKLAGLLTATVITATAASTGFITGSADAAAQTISAFTSPTNDQKPMARLWFPDAGAGWDDYSTIEKQLDELYEAGFGGVEITMLASGSDLTNETAKYLGWGTEAWSNILKTVLNYANTELTDEQGNPFVVDITITAHWPNVINNIDPNDEAASQEISYTAAKITETDLQETDYKLELPKQRVTDVPISSDVMTTAAFLTVDYYVSSALVKVDNVDGDGNVTYDLDSMIEVSAQDSGNGYEAGIPTKAFFEANQNNPGYEDWAGKTYDEMVLSVYGDEPAAGADLTQSFNGKMDSDSNRARMADWQPIMEADLTKYAGDLSGYQASAGNDIQTGDYVLVSIYRRGTGQIMSDAPFGGSSDLMYSRTYATNYFDAIGVDAVTAYWEENLLDDEMIALLKTNGSSIFEDSIELSHSASLWSHNLLDELEENDYSYMTELPVIIALGTSSFDDADFAAKIEEDYNLLLGGLYETDHADPIKEWSATFHYTYRAQPYSLTGLDITGASAAIDVPEGDNGTKGDGLRNISAAVNLTDKTYLSMEAVTGIGMLKLNWADVVTELAQNFSGGINRVILHGTPYSKSYNGFISQWPGWLAFGNNFSDSYTYRQTYWEDMDTVGDYVARNQAVLQTADARIDVAILNDKTTSFSNQKGNNFQTLLDNGYSYNIFSEAILSVENAKVSGGKLYEDGTGYGALIVNTVEIISADAMEILVDYAKGGLPIILYNTNPTDIYGTGDTSNHKTNMLSAYNQLISYSNVVEASSQTEIVSTLKNTFGIVPDADYRQEMLEITHYVDDTDDTDYYYAFNNPNSSNSGMIGAGEGEKYKAGDNIETEVTFKGNGIPYLLDAWTGEVTPIAEYTVNGDGTITTTITLSGGESAIIAITTNTSDFPAADDKYVVRKLQVQVEHFRVKV